MKIKEVIVDSNSDGVRADRFFRKLFKETALSAIYKMIRNGEIKVNGKKTKQDYRLKEGDVLVYPEVEEQQEEYSFIKLSSVQKKQLQDMILYEDSDVVVVNKQAGTVMHKGSGFEYGISELYKAYYQNSEFAFANRIDKATGGLVVAGKNMKSARELAKLIREREISKKYYLIVNGRVKEKEFIKKSYLVREETKVVEGSKNEGKESITKFEVIEHFGNYTLLEAELLTGRTHQIRVQISSEGYPIVGDSKYGRSDEKIMYLFSHSISINENEKEIDAGIPEYFKKFIEKKKR